MRSIRLKRQKTVQKNIVNYECKRYLNFKQDGDIMNLRDEINSVLKTPLQSMKIKSRPV